MSDDQACNASFPYARADYFRPLFLWEIWGKFGEKFLNLGKFGEKSFSISKHNIKISLFFLLL